MRILAHQSMRGSAGARLEMHRKLPSLPDQKRCNPEAQPQLKKSVVLYKYSSQLMLKCAKWAEANSEPLGGGECARLMFNEKMCCRAFSNLPFKKSPKSGDHAP
jgi:hypothetical protein